MPTIIDATVVNQAYDTSGNGGRRLVRLSNGWLIAATSRTGAPYQADFYKSTDNGATWSLLTSTTGASIYTNCSIVAVGTKVYAIAQNGGSGIYFWYFDATTVGATVSVSTQIETGQTATSNCSLAINSEGTELHAAWASKNSTYPNSFNIRYAKGTINADGSVTWGAVEQRTTINTIGWDYKNPTIVVRNDGYPIIFADVLLNGNYYIKRIRFNGSSWNEGDVYIGGLYTQSSPSACVDKNGRIWVAWHGRDATDTNANNIRVAYSDDGGVTWTVQKITSGNDSNYHSQFASITVNRNNVVFVVYSYGSVSTTFDVAMNSYNGSWSGRTIIKDVASTVNRYPSTLFDTSLDFTSPLFIYNDFDKVGFYGTWTVTTISVTPGYIGQKTSSDKSNILTYSITTDGEMSDIIEKINDVTIATRTNPTSGQEFTVSLTQEQWDAIKYGNGHTLTIEMGSDKWTYTFDKRLNVNDDILSVVKGVQDLQDHLNAIKAQLAEAIRAKGGTVNDTDAWSAFVSAISNMTNKRWATGTYYVTSSTVTVTGLNFKPSFIYLWDANRPGYSSTIYNDLEKDNPNYVIHVGYGSGNSGSINVPKAGNVTISNGSFSIKTYYNNYTVNWIAFE